MCRRTWLIVVIGALSVVACNGDDEKTEARRTTTTAVVVDTTTTAVPETTTTSEAPLSSEDQIRRTTAELFTTVGELYLNPDPDRVAEIYDPECPCYAAFQADLAELRSRGLRARNQNIDVLGVRLEDNSILEFPRLTLVHRADEQIFINSNGVEIERRPGTEPLAVAIGLVRRNGQFYVSNYHIFDDPDPAALQEVIDQGVP